MLAPYRDSGDVPSPQDIARITRLMIGTINGMIENINMGVNKAMNVLLSRPDALAGAITAAQKNDEKLLSQYIWEALRFDVGVPPFLLRDCREDYVLAKEQTERPPSHEAHESSPPSAPLRWTRRR